MSEGRRRIRGVDIGKVKEKVKEAIEEDAVDVDLVLGKSYPTHLYSSG